MTTSIAPDILAQAARLVAKHGPEGLTMARLGRATKLSRATLYRQCGSREAVLDALAAAGTPVGDRSGTRERILTAAREVFGRAGLEGASVEEIAALAGVGLATVYRQFGDKEALVAAFVEQHSPRHTAREARARATGDVGKDLERFAAQMLVRMRDDAPVFRLMLLEMLRGGSLLAQVRAMAPVRTLDEVAGLLRQHVAAGRLRAVDPVILARAFTGLLLSFGVVGPLLRGEDPGDPAETARVVTDLFLHGAIATQEDP